MKRILWGSMLLTFVIIISVSTSAGADININISLPPSIEFSAPPEMIVIPETYVYVDPDIDADLYFWNGWWWRPWKGRWYHSRHYNQGWTHYQGAPSFYRQIPSDWRNYYRDHRWGGRPWNYQRISHQQLQQNWNGWGKERHWEKHGTWGVQGLKYRTREHKQPRKNIQRAQQQKQKLQVRQEKQKHRENIQRPQQQKQKLQVRQEKQKPRENIQRPQQQKQKPQVRQEKQKPREKAQQQQRPQTQGKHEGGKGGHGK